MTESINDKQYESVRHDSLNQDNCQQSGNILQLEIESTCEPPLDIGPGGGSGPISQQEWSTGGTQKSLNKEKENLTLNSNVVELSIESSKVGIQLIREENLNECLELLKNYRPIFEQLVQISEQSNESQSQQYQSIDQQAGKSE